MTREQKLALIFGFALVLVVGVLVSDHWSSATQQDPLSTDGLDGAIAQNNARDINPLLVSRDPLDAIHARPEPEPVEGGLFDSLRGIGDLHQTNKTTGGANDSNEFVMGEKPEAEPEHFDDASRELEVQPKRRARVYVVRPNDSLWAIAEREYNDGGLHARLALYNHDRVGKDGSVREGASLLIPSKAVLMAYEKGDRRDVEHVGRRDQSQPDRRPSEPVKPRLRTHTVQKGETLSEICADVLGSARRWREVVELNNGKIPEDGTVRIGQEILLPAH